MASRVTNIITQNRFARWLSKQLQWGDLIRAGISSAILVPYPIVPIFTSSFFTFSLPLGWLFVLPTMLIYGAVKRGSIQEALDSYFDVFDHFKQNFAKDAGEWLTQTFWNKPTTLLRILAGFIFLAHGVSVVNLLSLYAVRHVSDHKWIRYTKHFFNKMYDFLVGCIEGIRAGNLDKKLILFIVAMAFLGYQLSTAGPWVLLMTSLAFGQIVSFYVGCKGLWDDTKSMSHRPITFTLKNIARFAGLIWGRYIAYKLFGSKMTFEQAPIQGIVHGSESNWWLLPDSKFVVNNSGIGLMWEKFRNAVNNILGDLFITKQVDLNTQTFHGEVGPSTGKLFLAMSAGYAFGYGIERLVDKFCISVATDAKNARRAASRKAREMNVAYYTKLHIGFIAGLTPLILMSEVAPQILAIAGENMLTATALTAGGLATSFALVYITGYLLMRMGRAISNGWENRGADNRLQFRDRSHLPARTIEKQNNVRHTKVKTPLYEMQKNKRHGGKGHEPRLKAYSAGQAVRP